MDIVLISMTALFASGLTLFSGFGLGTLLMPIVAIFFPIEVAVAITAIVHLANNLFKLALLGRYADWTVVKRFGLPALAAAFIGALVLTWLADLAPLYRYQLGGRDFSISLVKAIVGLLILGFVFIELFKIFSGVAFSKKYLPLGGLVSGFFGGLSGHQGAFRSMFLIKAGLSKEAFIATGVTMAVLVDVARLSIYGWDLRLEASNVQWPLVFAASLSAFLGAFIGRQLIEKMTIQRIQQAVSCLLVIVALGLITGLL